MPEMMQAFQGTIRDLISHAAILQSAPRALSLADYTEVIEAIDSSIDALRDVPLSTLMGLHDGMEALACDLKDTYEHHYYLFEEAASEALLHGAINLTEAINTRNSMLAERECLLMRQYLPRVDQVLFVGAGAFPISPIAYAALLPHTMIATLDISEAATQRAHAIVHHLGLESRIHVLTAAAFEDFIDFEQYDVTVVASMVGSHLHEKQTIYTQAAKHMPPGTRLCVRDVDPRYSPSLIYCPFPLHQLADLFCVQGQHRSRSPIIVTSMLLQRCG